MLDPLLTCIVFRIRISRIAVWTFTVTAAIPDDTRDDAHTDDDEDDDDCLNVRRTTATTTASYNKKLWFSIILLLTSSYKALSRYVFQVFIAEL